MKNYNIGDKVKIKGKKGVYTICDTEKDCYGEEFVHLAGDSKTAYSIDFIKKLED